MSDEFRSKAEELAQTLTYSVKVETDQTTESESSIFLLSIPELPGCMAQGATIAEANQNLAEVKIEYIQSLLEDGLPVPSGKPITRTGSSADADVTEDVVVYPSSILEDLAAASRPLHRRVVGEVSQIAS